MIYQISSGQGPAECELGVAKLWGYLQSHYDVTLLDSSPGYYAETFRSVRLYSEEDLSAAQNGKIAGMFTAAYLYEHREEADHHALNLTLRALLFGSRKEGF